MPSVWQHTALSCVRSLWLAEMLSAESVAIRSQAGTLSLHLTNCSFGKRQRALNAATALSCCLHVDRARIHIFIRMDGKVVGLGRPLILSCDQTLWRRFSTFATRPQRYNTHREDQKGGHFLISSWQPEQATRRLLGR